MKIHRFLLITGLSGGLCFVAGLAAARYSGEVSDPAAGEGAAPGATRLAGDRQRLTAISKAGGAGNDSVGKFLALVGSNDLGMYERMCGYFRVISEADPAEIPNLIARLQREVPEEMGREMLLRALGVRWAEKDPSGAFEALLAGKTPGLEEALPQVLLAVARTDARGAWQTMLEPDHEGSGLLANALSRDRLISGLIGAIALEDGGLAAEFVESLDGPGVNRSSFESSLRAFAKGNPQAFLERLEHYQSSSQGALTRAIEIAFAQSVDEDLESALGRLDDLEGGMRAHAELGLARSWSRSDPVAALAWAEDLRGATGRRAQSAIIRQLAKIDPATAADEVASLGSPVLRQEIAKQIASTWAREDRDAAVAWVREELEGQAREESYAELLRNHVRGASFDEDFELLKEMADGSLDMGWGHYQFAQEWAKRDPQAAAEWSLARPRGRDEMMAQVASEWARTDPEALAGFAGSLEDDSTRKVIEEQLHNYRESQPGGEGQQ